MNVQELRIGNRVKEGIVEHIGWRDGYYTVGCMKTGFEAAATFYDSEDIHQIPITEEILIKCGWGKGEYDSEYTDNVSLKQEVLSYNVNAKMLCIETNYDVIEIKHIQYLHQLQNIYFALTETELEINL